MIFVFWWLMFGYFWWVVLLSGGFTEILFILGSRVPISLWVGTARLGNWHTPTNVGFHVGLCSVASDMTWGAMRGNLGLKEPRTSGLQPATFRDWAFYFPVPARQEIHISRCHLSKEIPVKFVFNQNSNNNGGLHKPMPTPKGTVLLQHFLSQENWTLVPQEQTFANCNEQCV